MSSFLVRIELHDASYQDYTTLHSKMEAATFSRIIGAQDGTTYQLPTAEYVITGNYATSSVLEAAKKAAQAVGKRAGIIVALWSDCQFVGLIPVK